MIKKIFILIVIIFTLTGTLSSCSYNTVRTEHPIIGDIKNTVDENGTVCYSDSYFVKSSVNGRIINSDFQKGDHVNQGQILYTIDDTDIAGKISSAQINLNSAKAIYNQAVKAADDLSVKSYISGMLAQVNVNIGDYVSTGSKIAHVVDSEHLKLKLAYADTKNIQLGSAAKITVSDNTEIAGTVTKIDNEKTVFNGHQTGVYVEISFDNPGALISGETAHAIINNTAPIADGTIEYLTDDAIYSTGTGLVVAVNANTGDKVTPGTEIIVIKNNTISDAVTNASLNVSNAEESLKQLQGSLVNYTIKAPVSGIILDKQAKIGDFATASATLATLSNGNTLIVKANLDEDYISKVSIGQSAAITLTSDATGTVYNGTVMEVSNSGTITDGATYYTAKITLNRQDGLKDGMNVDVSITADSKNNCILVPTSYLINGNQIKVLEKGKTVTKVVKVGIADSKNSEIISGLSASDEIISK